MKMTIEATDQITHLEGVPARVWKGTTEKGVACLVFVHRIAVDRGADASELERALKEQLPPGRVVDLRKVL
jgi:hypothetical protein